MHGLISSLAFALVFHFSLPAIANEPAGTEDGGPRNWEISSEQDLVNLYENQSNDANVLMRYPKGTILSNLGCQLVADQYWCDVQKVEGGKRGYVKAEKLIPAAASDGTVGYGVDDSAERAGQGEFDATGKVPCALNVAQPMNQCDFGVARAGSGYATIVIKRPNLHDRIIFFTMGQYIFVSSSEASPVGEVSHEIKGDLHYIKVDDERYEIPDAVIFGG